MSTSPSTEPPVHYRTCPLCEAMCGLAITVQGDRVTRIRGDAEDVFSAGYLCPKGVALGELHDDPDRLRVPLIRDGDRFREATWEEAFARVAQGLRPYLEDTAARQAIGAYVGNPNVHNLAGGLFLRPLLKALGTRNIFSASTVDQIPKQLVSGLLFGDPSALPVPDVDRCDYLLLLGANPWASNGSLWTAPGLPLRLKALRKRGGRFVVVDPRRTLTARNADRHLPITPGTDALWLLALAQEIHSQGLASPGRLEAFTSGLDELDAALAPFTPEAVAPRCGIDASITREIARELAAAPRAAVYGRLGIQAARYGTLAAWATELLNVLTGNLDREGGVMFPLAAHERMSDGQAGGRGFRTGRWRSRVSGHPEVMGELPAAAMAEEIGSPGPGQLRALLTVAGNPVLSTPDGARLDRALATLDFMVSVDMYLNETTRHAQVILPPPSPLERDHYDVVFTRFAVRSVANYSPHLFPSDTPSEESILLQLAHLASHGTPSSEPRALEDAHLRGAIARELSNPNSPIIGTEVDEVLASLTGESLSERLLDLLLRTGPFGTGLNDGSDGLDLASLKANPHGIDFGPLRERLPGYLNTPSGTIEFAHDSIQGELVRARAELEGAVDERWLLIGRRDVHSNNSWMHNLPSLIERPERCTLRLHPDDAASLDVQDGALVRVRSSVGEVVAPAEVHEEMRRGVVSLPHGYGHGLNGVSQRYARDHAGVSVNDLVPGELDGPSGNAVLNGVAVTLSVLNEP